MLTLFRLEETEQVPAPTGEQPELTHSTIGRQVEAQYIRLPDAGSGCDYNNSTAGMAMDHDRHVSALKGRTDAVLLTLSQGSQIDYREYPVLLDLATGEVTDLLGGTGWEGAAPLQEVQWTTDLSAAIPSNDRTDWFYCDQEAKTTASLDAPTSLEVMDLEQGAFTLLDQENYDNTYEGVLGWFDEDRIAITAHGSADCHEAYLYLYRF